MTKHITDKPRETENGRLRAFTPQRPDGDLHPAFAALHRRVQTRPDDSRKAAEYARIERGRTT